MHDRSMHIDFKTLNTVLPFVIRSRTPVLIRARHGVGKSELAKSYDRKVASILYPDAGERQRAYGDANYVYPIVERRASQMADAGDLCGLPFQEGETTTFRPMKWFYEACIKPCILFVDEIDRGNQDVRQAFFELTDSRKIAGHTLHPDTIIIACVNGGTGDNAYQVGEMDPAEISRWAVFDAQPSVQDWIDWANDKVNHKIVDFIRNNNKFLEHSGEFEPNKVYPSRRSWVRFNRAVGDSDLLRSKDSGDLFQLYHVANAYLGHETAVTFQEFIKEYKNMVTVEDILEGRLQKAKELDINQHMTLIDKIADCKELQAELAVFEGSELKSIDSKLVNLAHYLLMIPRELVMSLWVKVTEKNGMNGAGIYKVKTDTGEVGNYIAEIQGAL